MLFRRGSADIQNSISIDHLALFLYLSPAFYGELKRGNVNIIIHHSESLSSWWKGPFKFQFNNLISSQRRHPISRGNLTQWKAFGPRHLFLNTDSATYKCKANELDRWEHWLCHLSHMLTQLVHGQVPLLSFHCLLSSYLGRVEYDP